MTTAFQLLCTVYFVLRLTQFVVYETVKEKMFLLVSLKLNIK